MNYVDENGDTSLILVCHYNISEVALKLLDMNCRQGQITENGHTASREFIIFIFYHYTLII